MIRNFPHFMQPDTKDCGPTCIKIIAKSYGKNIALQKIRELAETNRLGSTLLNLSDAAEHIGFRTLAAKTSVAGLNDILLPGILHWKNNHYVVLYKIKKGKYFISDPAQGLVTYKSNEFFENWIGENSDKRKDEGVVLLLEPTPAFYGTEFKDEDESFGFSFLFPYLLKYKRFIWQVVIGLLAGSLLQMLVPFLTQSIVDVGIKTNNVDFVYLILLAQLFLFFGRTAIEVIRSWILLHLSTRINISLISDFFIKLMNLPISYFDVRLTGDILQRINDHKRIERILTTSSFSVLFSLFNLIIFGIVLLYYSSKIFTIFLIGSLFYFGWILLFLKKRKTLDYLMFSKMGEEQSKVIEIINGMQDIKLHNAEKQKRWGWEYIQASLFKLSVKSLVLEQYQAVGSNFINELKNIIITFVSAVLVINGEITIGMMLAITYIVGQLNSPIAQLINFIREIQDAKISLDRLAEIHNKKDEYNLDLHILDDVPDNSSIVVKNLSFAYNSSTYILKNINFTIPLKKVTAIVGGSGSGKTTLLKLLLKFYEPNLGEIEVGEADLAKVEHRVWRQNCGAVMQEGHIFNDSIAGNIAVGTPEIDKDKLLQAATVANIHTFVEQLPQNYNTKVGSEGLGLSTGQRQRLLIARAIYKNPQFLFFDEATSALDAENERIIMDNLNEYFENRTVVIIAHRLSTVKNADQIIVLDEGEIAEIGDHDKLIELRGKYFNLIKNQLELGQ